MARRGPPESNKHPFCVMGVDFDSCDDCGECVCDQNLKYLNLDGYGRHKTCQFCVREHFTVSDPRSDVDQCVEVLNDAIKSESIIFYRFRFTDCDEENECSWTDAVAKTYDATEALGWIRSGNAADYVISIQEAWEPRPSVADVYHAADRELPILEAAEAYEEQHQKVYGYSPFNGMETIVPKAGWTRTRIRQLDDQIRQLKEKRRCLKKL